MEKRLEETTGKRNGGQWGRMANSDSGHNRTRSNSGSALDSFMSAHCLPCGKGCGKSSPSMIVCLFEKVSGIDNEGEEEGFRNCLQLSA